jgi:hypothetical protein
MVCTPFEKEQKMQTKKTGSVPVDPGREETGPDEILAWEQIDPESWLPYRVRGSWRGGVLG